jgi:hypothetical protein
MHEIVFSELLLSTALRSLAEEIGKGRESATS